MPVCAIFLLKRVVNSNAVAPSGNTGQVAVPELLQDAIVPLVGHQPHESGDLFDGVIDFPA